MQKKQQKSKEQPSEKGKQAQSKQTQLPQESLLKPVKVQYCPICTLPFEFCDFGGKAQKCLDWKKKNKPELVSEDSVKPATKQQKQETPKEQPEEKKQKGSKAKKYIVYDVTDRTKKKHITTISGLQGYGINAKDFAKKCSKKFACSCSNVNDDKVQIQGDISEVLVEFMGKQYDVKQKYIVDLESYKKKMKKLEDKGGKKQKGDQKQQPNTTNEVKTEKKIQEKAQSKSQQPEQ